MKKETKLWISYAEENLKSAKILYKSYLFNVCLQNIQQAIEKYLKSILIENNIKIRRTHQIDEKICERCIQIAEKIQSEVMTSLEYSDVS